MATRLADGVRVEPLVFGWPAWWCTMAPGAAALHALRFQLPGLRSYLRSPSTHVRAANDPRLAGGSFVGVPEHQSGLVAELLRAMEAEYRDDVAFAESWIAFNERLREIAAGQTMEPIYPEIPEPLGGLVELGYDYDNRPSVRFDEGLAYRSSLYRSGRQQILLRGGARADDARPFYMSTPVLSEDALLATVPFRERALMDLLDLDVRPATSRASAEELLSALGPSGIDARAWLTEAPLAKAPPWSGTGVRARYIGHACILIEHGRRSVLVDPLVPQGAHGEGVFGFESLPERIDVAVVTHAHPDHFDLETLVRLRARVDRIAVPRSRGLLIGDVSLARILRELGYTDVLEVDTADRIGVGEGAEIVALPFLGEHGDVLHGSKATYWIRFGTTTILATADSACLDPRTYARSRELVGKIDHVFMNTEVDGAPISWPFDALFPKKRDRKLESTRKCRGSNVAEGLTLLETVGASHLYIYAMGLEPWVQRITGPASKEGSPRMLACHELIARAKERGVIARHLFGAEDIVLGGGG